MMMHVLPASRGIAAFANGTIQQRRIEGRNRSRMNEHRLDTEQIVMIVATARQ